MGDLGIRLHGQQLVLLPERAVFWVEQRTLLVADTHWGKAASFRAAGLAVPRGTTGDGLSRLGSALERTGARRIVFLGDFLHAREGRVARTLDALRDWRDANPALDMLLVRGNHDRHAGDPPAELRIRCVQEPWTDGPFAFRHYPGAETGLFVLAGHLHPAVKLSGRGRQRARLPCFWFRPDHAVLPAFGDFTGSADVRPDAADRLFVVAGDSVIEIGG